MNKQSLLSSYPKWTNKQTIMFWAIWFISLAAMFLSVMGIDGNATDKLLQHVPTTIALIALIFVIRHQLFSPSSLICIFAFLWIHIIGARYLYSYVPYDQWFSTLTGTSLNSLMGWERNMYDRFVHLSYGLLLAWPTREFLLRYVKLTATQANYFAIEFIMASSMVYELIEYGIAIQFSPEEAENYNGQQGDIWDAQKDMLLASVGSIITIVLGTLSQKFRTPNSK